MSTWTLKGFLLFLFLLCVHIHFYKIKICDDKALTLSQPITKFLLEFHIFEAKKKAKRELIPYGLGERFSVVKCGYDKMFIENEHILTYEIFLSPPPLSQNKR
jgi:hypothetical protein